MRAQSSSPFQLRPAHDARDARAHSAVADSLGKRMRREAAREWFFLVGSALFVVVVTVGVAALAMR